MRSGTTLRSLFLLILLTAGCGSGAGDEAAAGGTAGVGAGGRGSAGAGAGPVAGGGTQLGGQGSAAGSPSTGPMPGGSLDIPSQHPRLFFDTERLERARGWFASHGFEPGAVDDASSATDAAFHYLLTGDSASARGAIDWALAVEVNTSGNGSDVARWDGEAVILVFDWCHSALAEQERTTLVTRWNTYIAALNAQDWGGVGMEGNNYYLGNVRNTLEWAVATHGESDQAAAFLAYALDERWKDSFLPYAGEFGKGGVMHEGSAYGRRVLDYWTVPLATAELLGRNMWDETPFFRESLYWLIYSTTPGPSAASSPGSAASLYETWPMNEDERWLERDATYNTAQTTLGDYLTPLLSHYRGLPIAGHVASFLERTGAAPERRFIASLASAEPAREPSELPLDYFAAGLGLAYAKTAWSDTASAFQAQVSTPVGVGHNHLDAGTFQLWRKGRFVSRETVGYTDLIAGYAGSAERDCRDTVGHNGLLYDGRGSIDWQDSRPETLNLASTPDFFFVTMDLTGAYTIREDQAHRELELVDGLPLGNPGAARTVREFLFIRPLETLVIVDRMQADGPAPNDVIKTFLLHFAEAPTSPSPNVYLGQNADQTLRATTVLPPQTERRVVSEGGNVGQFRAEIEASGSVETLFLHVLEMRDVGDPALTITLEDSVGAARLVLRDAARGTAELELASGASATGGSFGYAASGDPTLVPLRQGVQPLEIDYDGVRWMP